MSRMKTILLALAMPLALAACVQHQPGTAIPTGGVEVVPVASSVPARGMPEVSYGSMRVQPHPTHPTVAYEALHECTNWNTAYAMHEMAGKYQCAALYTPGTVQAYRFVVFRDAHGNAYTTGTDGRWVRNPAYDGYVQGDQPHR